MRPQKQSFSPVTASVTGFASNVTGGTWTLSTTATSDGLAHTVTIKNDSVTDHSGKTATLVGTDAQGNAQTETLTMPGTSATVTSTKYFKTLTSVTPSATIGADTMDIGWSAVSVSQCLPMDWPNVTAGGIAMSCVISGTINFTVQHTLDDLWSSTTAAQDADWLDHSSIAADTASVDGNYAFPVRGIRFKTNSVTNGATVEFIVIQGRA